MIYISLIVLFFLSLSGLILKQSRLSKYITSDFVALGAGAMIAVSLVHIFPESLEISKYATLAFMGGFLMIYILENFLIVHSCVEDACHYHNISWMSWITLFVHTIFDGVGIAAAFILSPELGYMILVGVAIHQIPVSFSLALLFRESHFSLKIQTIFMVLFALAIPMGFFFSFAFLGAGNTTLIALLMAISGGSLLYIAASDLLPVVHKKSNNRIIVVILFLIGAVGVSLARFLE